MRYLKIVILLLFALSTSDSLAQKTNAEKILGCWVIKKIEFIIKDDYSEELIKHAQNALICFSADGKFTTTLAKSDSELMTGSYKISDDGKIMSQKSDLSEDFVVKAENDVEIEFLDDKHLILKFESTTTYFDRK